MNEIITSDQRSKRIDELVVGHSRRRHFAAITRIIGGAPMYDLQDYDDSDASSSHPDDHQTGGGD